jgi:hypothetical protein
MSLPRSLSIGCISVALATCTEFGSESESGGSSGSSSSSGGSGGSGTGPGSTGPGVDEPPAVVAELASVAVAQAPIAGPAVVAPEVEVEPPLGHRIAARTMVVLAEPRWGAALRGRIDMGHAFAIYETVEGKGCTGEGWARIDHQGFVCLRDTTASRRAGRDLPVLAAGRVVPFIYGKPRADRAGKLLASVPRYRSVEALLRGDPPVDHLEAHHQYAFIESRRVAGGIVLVDRSRRAVRAEALQLERPSEFRGRDLALRSVAADELAAWSAEAPTLVRAAPGAEAEIVGRIDYHRELALAPTPVRQGGVDWYALQGEGMPAGYVSDEDVRRWIPHEPLAEVGAEELWLDIELEEQTLAVYRGEHPIFVTLISSGAGKNPTPRGIFRIWHKQALGDMSSRPGDADSYTVEDVPWVQYFHRRFALHTAFWHNKFGRRRSHGCVNLAPRDAAYLFGLTTPDMPGGWTFAYEHEEAVGTTLRIRKGVDPVPDRRRAIGDADESDPDEQVADAAEEAGINP